MGTYTEGTNGGGDVTFSGSITGSTIEFYGNKQGSSTLSVNGVDKTSLVPASVGWFTITGVTNITALAFNRGASGNYVDLYAIRVDGVILLDADTSNFGRNGCYLPFDGSALIGQDQSRRGNDWTPINFGGSVALDSPIVSGARPLLNTVQGGSQADLGVFGSKENVGYAVTVYDDGGGNKYYIDGVKQATLTGLIRGATYTFDTSDSTVATHPFVFGSTANGNNFARGANYGSVSAGSAGAATTITIPYDAPETLYYHCSSHSGMGGSIVGIHTDETKADQYASNCVLALPLVSAISDVSASVACTSTTKTMSSGNATVAGEQSNFYANSYNLTGSSSYINTSAGTDFAYGTVDFTVEAWIFSTNTSNNTIYTQVESGTNYFVIVYNSNNTVSFLSSGGNLTTTNTLARDKWHHVAVVRKSGTVSIYLNGQKAVSGSITYDYSNTTYNPTVGTYTHSVNTENLTGYIQDFRIYKGAAKYDGDFVVPSTTPDIVPVSPTGVSGGSKLAKITNGGTSFAGTATSKLTLADSTDFTFGSNDFAIEFWYYTQTLDGTYNIFFDCMGSNRSGIQLAIETDGDYRIEVGDGSNNWIWQLTDKDAKAGKWTHFALTRESNKIRFFEDGKFIAQQTSSTAVGDPRSPAIGGYASDDSTNYGFEGIISNFRIVNGSAVYTTDFTPSRSPLTNITNTKLLCCQSPTVVTEGAVKPGDITAAGDAAASTFNPFNTDVRTVRGQESDYMTISPLSIGTNSVTISDGNFHFSSGGTNQAKRGSITFPSTGKWFWEMTMEDGGSGVWLLGVSNAGNQNGAGRLCYVSDARKLDESNSFSGYGRGYSVGDVIGVALDLDEDTLAFYKNGVFLGTAFTAVSNRITGGISAYFQGEYSGRSFYLNSGQKPFKFPPPAGFQPPNTANTRPVDVISRPDQYVGIVTYMGAGGTKNVDGLKFSPDMVWVKALDSNFAPMLGDSVRGFSETTMLSPSSNAEEDRSTDPTDGSERGYISAKNIRGFNVTDGTGTSQVNGSGEDYVAWCWKAGGNSGNFNVDYVGYSTAGDAAMSIADQNTTGYNTDQNWGSGATGEINPGGGALESGCFNGSFSDSINSYWGDASKAITYTFNNLPFKKIRFYAVANNVSNSYVKFNEVAQTQARIGYGSLKFGWFEAKDVPSPLNKIQVFTDGSSDFISLYAVEVDGKILVNSSGVTPPNLPSIPATGASVGTKQGFSIVTYTGTGSAGTIPHRLTQDPEFVIFKQRNNQDDWRVFHKDLDSDEAQDYYLILQSTNGKSADQNQSFMNRVPPTGPVIHLGTDSAINGSSTTMVAYSWHSVPGLQKFGTFAGNSDADGTFVELGFRPALLWVKRTDSTGNWVILTAKRSPFNPVLKSLYADSSDDEYTPGQQWADLLSNGFKIRATYGEVNVGTYVYCAWAEAPSIDLYGGGANAR